MPGTSPLDVPGAGPLQRKIQELKGRATQPKWQRLLDEMAEEIQGEFNLQRVLERVMDALITLTRAQRGFLILLQARRMQFKVRRNIDRQTLQGPFCEVSENVARLVFRTGEIFNSEDAREDPRLMNFPSVQALGLRSILAIPFRYRRQTIGVVYLDNRTSTSAFADANVDILRSFASLASQAIHVADLVTRLKLRMHQLDRANRKLKNENRVQSVQLLKKDRVIERVERDLKRRYSYDNIIGQSPAMQKVFTMLDHLIPQESTTLITGETGTGKELIARAIHYLGPRKDKPFVPVNCAAIPETLLESELFGHAKGAFTGASEPKSGLTQLADTGTLFLDEIGEMSPPLQAKLLRLIQEGEVKPVGDARSARVDVRVIAATNQDLKQLSHSGGFRRDLYYRLSVFCVHLPPLRDRIEDIPALADSILSRLHREKKLSLRTIDPDALEPLLRYSWPGNVREFENMIERLMTFSTKSITRTQVERELNATAGSTASGFPAGGVDLKNQLDRLEGELVLRALKSTRNKSEAARLLNIDRTWFLRLLKKHNLQ
jgi:transcriptional regulator with GAF, ATPase, and Fis domain